MSSLPFRLLAIAESQKVKSSKSKKRPSSTDPVNTEIKKTGIAKISQDQGIFIKLHNKQLRQGCSETICQYDIRCILNDKRRNVTECITENSLLYITYPLTHPGLTTKEDLTNFKNIIALYDSRFQRSKRQDNPLDQCIMVDVCNLEEEPKDDGAWVPRAQDICQKPEGPVMNYFCLKFLKP